jgi:hypothetical protein
MLIPVAVAIMSASAQDYQMSRWTVDGGGVMFSTGDGFELSGTIGQPDAEKMIGQIFTLTGGFWFSIDAADCNVDGGIDVFDFSNIQDCLSGPDSGPLQLPCLCLDLDGDEDVDLADVAVFQGALTGG